MNDINEQQFGGRIRQALNQGSPLDARILERLRTAREHALDARLVAPAGRLEPAADWNVSGGGVLGRFGGLGGFSLRVVLPVAVVVAGVFGIYSWQQAQ